MMGHVLLVVVLRGEDRHLHALALLREKIKRFGRRPVVDQDQRSLRVRDERQHQRAGIPELPVVEHALQRRCLRLDKEIDFVLQFSYICFRLGKPAIHLVFKLVQTGVYDISAY